MMYLKQSATATIKMGPFLDDTDGKTAETGLTISQADVRLSKAGAAFAQKNESSSATHDENGWYGVALNGTDTGTLGRLQVAVAESGALPVWQDFMVLKANVYDALIAGSDRLQVDAVEISSDQTAAEDLELLVENCKGADHKMLISTDEQDLKGTLHVDAAAISDDPTAADNLEAMLDGTGGVMLKLKQLNIVAADNDDAIVATGSGTGCGIKATGGATGAGMYCQGGAVGSGLHCMGGAASGSGILAGGTTSGAGLRCLGADTYGGIEAVGGETGHGVCCLGGDTTGDGIRAEAATDGSGLCCVGAGMGNDDITGDLTGNITGNLSGSVGSVTAVPSLLISTSIASLTSQTEFTLTAGADFDGAYAGQTIVFYDASNNDYPSVRRITSYTGATKTVVIDSAPDFTIVTALDIVKIFAGDTLTAADVTAATLSAAQVNAEVDTALADINLDHLLKTALPTGWETDVHADSALGNLARTSEGTYSRATHSQEAIADALLTAAEVNAEVDTALADINLDHLLKTALPTNFATDVHVSSAIGQLAQTSDGGYDRATDSLEAIRDRGDAAWSSSSSNPNVLADTTIASVTSQTVFTLTAGADFDDAYDDQAIVVYDASNNDYPSVRKVNSYVGATKTVTIDSAPDFTIIAADGVKIFATAPGTTAPTAAQNADAVWDEAIADHTGSATYGEELHVAKAVLANRRIHNFSGLADVVKDNDGSTTLLTLTPVADEGAGTLTVTPS